MYLATLLGAVALVMLMPRRTGSWQKVGMILGAAALGGAWLSTASLLPAAERLGIATSGMIYYYIFSALAIVSAVRVITHKKPVFSALWFVMTVLSTCGLFLILSAEFVAFAMVIIYAGAILVTYVFVIMLASEPGEPGFPGDEAHLPPYETSAREPVAAAAAGFLLLAVLMTVAFEPIAPNPDVRAQSDEVILETMLANRPVQKLYEQAGDERLADIMTVNTVTNPERIGLDLFESHPLGLELAGIILLISLVGAVIIARMRLDHVVAEVPE